ncbi:uncharacterized protein LAESUDRAFT_730897 [Laetiporus sulphureus 93-53]|uniref:Uncharacterized protein n=1 Tax=Laetiporus sulphureus 93-53 TaxID=1314785 RepID=A0A165BXA9_9APHY|nr:uncharacterized protein LAESUDRAFT_730897 [Laetiporus sulphureus 93-53]KZT01821.1 hypothetical protein LAESUDRAFT_730897 [Laetiporus sulphureus 93-53]
MIAHSIVPSPSSTPAPLGLLFYLPLSSPALLFSDSVRPYLVLRPPALPRLRPVGLAYRRRTVSLICRRNLTLTVSWIFQA